MTRKFLSSNVAGERLLSRDGRFSLFDGRLLDASGFLIDSEAFKELKTFEEIVKDGNALIVAEGGMGKSHVLREYCSSLNNRSSFSRIELVTYLSDVQGLKEAIRRDSREKEYLFLDGLDEALDLVGVLIRELESVNCNAHVVITSRGVPQLNQLSERLKWPMFSLLPYSRDDVRELCEEEGIDYGSFIRKIDRQNLGGVCSKPLGCKLLMSAYQKTGLKNSSTESLWRDAIRHLCAENPASGRQLSVKEDLIPEDDGIRIATIVALALKLTGRTIITRITNLPQQDGEIDFSKLFPDKADRDAFNTLLLRPLFLNIGKGVYRFTHSSYLDFLAADGVIKYLSEKEWGKVVLSPEGVPYPQWEGVIPWLAARSDSILKRVKKSRPDLLLGTDALVDKLGADEICKAILDHAEGISSSVRDSPAVQARYYALNSDRCVKVIRKELKATPSEVVADTAIDIIRQARMISAADLLVGMFCDESLELGLRKSAGYALLELANKAQRTKCKQVLKGDRVNQLKGIVLRMTWPDLMSVDELIPLLSTKHGHVADSFSMWIEGDGFVASLHRIPSAEKLKLLRWAVSEIKERDDSLDCVADARRSIFLHCWKEERSAEFIPELARGIAAYDAVYESPFRDKGYEWRDSSRIFSEQDFRNDVARRHLVAKYIVENPELSLDAVYGCWEQLLLPEDGDFVLDSLAKESNGKIRERWATCLWRIRYVCLPEKAILWNELHKEFPSIYKENATRALRSAQDFEAKMASIRCNNEKRAAKRKAKNEKILSQNIDWAHKVLSNGDATGKFYPINCVIEQQQHKTKGVEFSMLDFRTSTLWPSFTSAEKQCLVASAYDFLIKGKGPWSSGQSGYDVYVRALCMLYDCGRGLLDRMPIHVWRKVAPELLWHLELSKFELLPATLKYFCDLHKKASFNVILQFLRNSLKTDLSFGVKRLREILSEKEFYRLLQNLDEDSLTDEQRYKLYDNFIAADSDIAVDYIRKKYRGVRLKDCGILTMGCVIVSMPCRFPELQKELDEDPEWGVSWAKQVLPQEDYHHATITRVLSRLSDNSLMEFYSWLHVHFPPEKEPQHEGAFFLDATDLLYRFISFVFNELMLRVEPEAVFAIEELHRRFPKHKWFYDCALRLRGQLLAGRCPMFELDAVTRLLKSKRKMLVINCADDLLHIVLNALDGYQTDLTGVKNPQVKYLWNENQGRVIHKSEEDLSDHIQKYLSDKLPQIVSNREVQLNRGRNGKRGARTDIWIDAFEDETSEPLRLCIEVKGSWNYEIKTAFESQLVGKYMGKGGADAGIFLVGWFESKREQKKTCIDKKGKIAKLLSAQGTELRQKGYKVEPLILDCSF